MTERPILFSAPMVCALLADRKSQTRRIVKHVPMLGDPAAWCAAAKAQESGWVHIVGDYRRFCPYGQPGDRLWCKETWRAAAGWDRSRPLDIEQHSPIQFEADGLDIHRDAWDEDETRDFGRIRQSIFMRRWMSRLTLEITCVRVERLQDISEEDAIAEGICMDPEHIRACNYKPIEAYRRLWNSLNLEPKPVIERDASGKKRVVAYVSFPWCVEDFDAKYHHGIRVLGVYYGKPITVTPNPWVWVLGFKRVGTSA